MVQFTKHFYNKFRASNKKLMILEFIFNAIFLIILLPLLHNALGYVMNLWGKSYITDKNLLPFLIFPPTILLLLSLVILLPLLILWKMTAMIQYCFTVSMGNKPNYIILLVLSFLKTLRAIIKGNLLLPFYAFLLYLYINIPLLLVIATQINPSNNIFKTASVWLRGFLFLLIILLPLFFQGLFTMHYCVNERVGFFAAMKQTKALLIGRKLRSAALFLLYNLLITLGYYLIYNLTLIIMALLIYFFADKTMVVTTFLSYYPNVKYYMAIFLSMVSTVINLNLISSLYHSYREESDPNFNQQIKNYQEEEKQTLQVKRQKRALTFVMFLLSTAGLVNFYLAVKNDSLFLQEALSGIQIVSHRGSSIEAPENTLPSLEYAIAAHADYAEIDVQQTKDGVLVLLHDITLKRTAGVNKPIWDITFDELQTMEAGSWFSEEYAGTPIPTLEEALKLCKGRIKLNIEVKTHGYEDSLEERLVELIQEYDFKYQCIVSSWNYSTLMRIKQLDEEIRTGHILSAAFGQFYDRDYVDFLSLRSSFINKSIVENVHKAGKEIHAWTVNTRSEMERMKSLGVDSIITDNPHLAKAVLLRDDTNATFVELLNHMLRNNFLYQIVK